MAFMFSFIFYSMDVLLLTYIIVQVMKFIIPIIYIIIIIIILLQTACEGRQLWIIKCRTLVEWIFDIFNHNMHNLTTFKINFKNNIAIIRSIINILMNKQCDKKIFIESTNH